MLTRILPTIGNWYENPNTGVIFEVVAIDDDLIALQYFDGEVEEIDTETFIKSSFKAANQPEDWSGPFEIDPEDRQESDFFTHHDIDLQEPGIDPEYMQIIE